MMVRCIATVMVWVGLAACGASADGETLQARIDAQLARNAQRYGVAGQAVLVARNGKTIYRGSHGLANLEANVALQTNDVFPVFSVSKLVASTLVMQLVERGELDLDGPIGRYLADLPEMWRPIKVRQLLNHVSGLPDFFDPSITPIVLPATRDAMFKELGDKPLLFTPGTSTRYTQTNYVLLAAILEAHYGVPYRQIVTERITTPLGLNNTYLGKSHVPNGKLVRSYIGKDDRLMPDLLIDWREYSIAHAELFSTIDDLGAFLSTLCEGRLLKQDTLLELWKPHRDAMGELSGFVSGWEYGTSGRYRHVGHDGGTKVRVRLVFDGSLTTDTYVFIYLTNGSASNVWSRTLLDSVMAVVAPDEF